MSAFDDAITAPAEKETVADLRVLDSKKKGAESRAADEAASAVLLDRYRYNPGLGWLEWDGRRWDGGEVAADRVHETVRQFIDEVERDYRAEAAEHTATAALIVSAIEQRIPKERRTDKDGNPMKPADVVQAYGTKEQRAAFDQSAQKANEATTQAAIWLNLLSAGHVAAVAKLCRGMDGILTRAAAFDAHPDLLNCHNGVVDLRTGELQAHDPDLLITHLAGAAYDPAARSALWDQALTAVHPGALDWFQIRMGQAITGHTPDDDAIVVSVGGGENGKTGVTTGIMRGCGAYGRLISHRILIAQPGQHPLITTGRSN